MRRKKEQLTDKAIQNIKTPGRYAVGGIGAEGLHLQVSDNGARSWILRYTWGTRDSTTGVKTVQRRRELGLGSYPTTSLADARRKAQQCRAKIEQNIDPIDERRAAARAARYGQGPELTFGEAATQYIEERREEWSNDKHVQQWTNTLATYAEPTIGKLSVRDIDVGHIDAILRPIWNKKTETANRVRGRIETILDWAKVRGYRDGENPAQWKGRLDQLFASPRKVRKTKNHAALPVARIGGFVKHLRAQKGNGARSLEFAILTAARSGEVRMARWREIDFAEKVWTIPAERMKARKEHRVPLSARALALLKAMPKGKADDLIFPSPTGKVQSDMTLAAVVDRMHAADIESNGSGYTDPKQGDKVVTPHGFRSTFRDWAAEETHYPREVAEMALAHTIESQTEAAYRRGDLFEKRVAMMGDWAKFCNKTQSA